MQKTFHYDRTRIFYTIEGNGLPVVLLHGLPLNGSIWNQQIEFLKDHCKLIVPDIPGSGKSVFEKPEPQATTIEYYASCIHAIKIRKVKGETGHAANNKIPEKIARAQCGNFFNQKNLLGNIVKVLKRFEDAIGNKL